jgi:hypothetical protein
VAVGALAAKGVVRDLAVEAWTREAARHGVTLRGRICGSEIEEGVRESKQEMGERTRR